LGDKKGALFAKPKLVHTCQIHVGDQINQGGKGKRENEREREREYKP
jgi:hypothetical protein